MAEARKQFKVQVDRMGFYTADRAVAFANKGEIIELDAEQAKRGLQLGSIAEPEPEPDDEGEPEGDETPADPPETPKDAPKVPATDAPKAPATEPAKDPAEGDTPGGDGGDGGDGSPTATEVAQKAADHWISWVDGDPERAAYILDHETNGRTRDNLMTPLKAIVEEAAAAAKAADQAAAEGKRKG